MAAFYDSGATYGSVYYSGGGATTPTHTMSLVKLALQEKDDQELRDFAIGHRDAMVGNPNFTTPDPLPAVFDPDLQAFVDDLLEEADLKAQLAAVRARIKTVTRPKVEQNLTGRGRYVQGKSNGGQPAIILSAALDVQDEGTPTTSLAQPLNLVASVGDSAGEVDLGVNRVPRVVGYIWECREHIEGQVPGPWTQAKVSRRSSVTVPGLVPGREYAFRVRALGPNEVESAWSDEAVSRAA